MKSLKMVGSEISCRLCMSTETLTDLFKTDGDTTLDRKIKFCLDLKMSTEDNLPVVICKTCEKNIKNFYDFKQKCLYVDAKLRAMKSYTSIPNKLTFDDADLDSIKMDVKLECDLFNKLDDFKNTFDSWLSDDNADASFYMDYFNNQTPAKVEENKPTSEQKDIVIISNTEKIRTKKQSPKLCKEDDKIYQCEICGCIVNSRSVLSKHIATHSGIKQFPCKLCCKTFTRAEHKVVHMRTHLGIKPFICEICGKASTKRQDLLRHMRIHSDEKKYSCPTCSRRFKRSGDVHSHMRTHTGAKPYGCNYCEKSYTSHSGLRKHYKFHCKTENTNIHQDIYFAILLREVIRNTHPKSYFQSQLSAVCSTKATYIIENYYISLYIYKNLVSQCMFGINSEHLNRF